MAKRKLSPAMKKQQKKFKDCTDECVGGSKYRKCMTKCLRKD